VPKIGVSLTYDLIAEVICESSSRGLGRSVGSGGVLVTVMAVVGKAPGAEAAGL